MFQEKVEYPEDLKLMAWAITAKHLCRGEEDVTKIVADAIWQERQRWVTQLMIQPVPIASAS